MKKTITLTVIALVIAGTAIGFHWPLRKTRDLLTLPGVVEVEEVRLGSKVGGRVAEVHVEEGQQVKAGQALLRFEIPELKAKMAQIQAQLDAATAELEKAKNGPRQQELAAAQAAVEAAKARLARLEAGSRPEEIEEAEGNLAVAATARSHAWKKLRRERQIQRRVASSDEKYEEAQAAFDQALEKERAAKARLQLLKAGARAEEIAEAKAEARRLEAQYELLQSGTRYEEIAKAGAKVAELEARLAEVKAQVKEAVVLAPDELLVEVLAAHKGDLLAPGQTVIRALRRSEIEVKVYVPETELGNLRVGQAVEVTVDSHPNRPFPGKILHIASISEFTPRNVQTIDERRHQVHEVKVRVEDQEGIFKAGMAAEVKIPLAK